MTSLPEPGVRVLAPVRAASGAAAQVVVALHNPTSQPCDVVLSAIGLDPSWTGPATVCGPVPPGGTIEASLTITVPPGSPAGAYPFLVNAQPVDTMSGAPTGPAQQADAEATVGDASRILVAVEPAEPAGVRGRRFAVVVDNRTPDDVQLTLTAEAVPGLWLRLRRPDVTVPAGQVVRVRAHGAVHQRVSGQARRFPFVVTAQGHTTPTRVHAVFVAKPLFGTTLTRVAAGLALISIWATLAFFALGKVSQHAHHNSTTTLTVGQGGGAGAAAGGGGSGGAAGAGAASGTSTVAGGGRINGVVTGAQPAGVRVTLRPTSLVDESAEGATRLVAAVSPLGSPGKLVNVAYTRPTAVSRTKATTTHADGSWAFAGVTGPGYYLLTFSKPGYQTVRQVITRDAAAAQPIKVALVAGTGTMSGAVTGPAGRTPGATVTLTDGTVTLTTSTPTSGAIGNWSISGLSTPATYLVSAHAPGLATASRLVTLRAGGTARHVDVGLQRGVESLVGLVTQVDETGDETQAGGVTVSATDGKTVRSATTITQASSDSPQTDSPVGAFTLPDLPVPGAYDVTFAKDGYAPRTQRVVLDGHASQLSLTARLVSSAALVTGHVRDSSGNPIGTAGIVLTGDAGTYKSTTDDNGQFRLSGVAPGTYVLSAEKFSKVTQFASIDAVGGSATPDITLTLPDVPGGVLPATAHIRGRVVDARTGGLITCTSDVKPADCVITVSTVDHRADGDHAFSVLDKPDAEYVLPPADDKNPQGLLSGLHRVTFSAPGYEPASITVQVPLGGFAEAPQVALYPEAGLTGTITSGVADTLPSNTCVLAVPTDGQTTPPTPPCTPPTSGTACAAPTGGGCALVNTTSGDYSLPDLAHGSYLVFVIPSDPLHEWLPVSPAPVTLALGETKRYDATLNRLGRVHLVVRIPGGGGALTSPDGTLTVTATGPVTRTITVDDTALGDVLVKALPSGSYALHVSETQRDGTSYTGDVGQVAVTQNQTAEATSVMVTTPRAVIGRVVYKVGTSVFGVAGASVDVTGTVGFTGTTPQPKTLTVTTDSKGCFAVTPTGATPAFRPVDVPDCDFVGDTAANIGAAAFGDPQVSIVADATALGFPAKRTVAGTANAVETVIQVDPPARAFTGSLLIDGAAPTGVDMSRATLTVTTSTTGAGTIVITPDSKGVLTWQDSGFKASNEVVPGTYEVRASLPGYDDGTATFDCPFDKSGLNAAPCALSVSLGSHVGLTVDIWGDSSHNVKVYGAVVTLSGNKLAPITVTAPPGSNSVNFPDLSAGNGKTTYSLEVHASGYEHTTENGLTFTAGSGGSVHDVVLNPLGSITGYVYGQAASQNTPLGGATVTVTSTTNKQTFTATSDGDGRYTVTGTTQIDGLEPGTWSISATLAGYHTAVAVPDITIVSGGGAVTQDITLAADGVRALLKVVDDTGTGTAVTGATVTMTAASSGTVFSGTYSSSAGGYLFCDSATPACLAPTLYSLQVTAKNYSPLSTTVSLQVGLASQTLLVTLAGRHNAIAVHVQGQVGIATPTDLSGATVTISSVDSAGALTTVKTGTTDTNGDFPSGDLNDGTYQVAVTKADYSTVTRSLTLSAGQLAAVEITIQKSLGQLTVSVSSTTKADMTGALVALVANSSTAQSQAAQQASGGASGSGTATTTFNNVAPGDYTVTTSGPGDHVPGSASVTVTSGSQTVAVTVDEMDIQLKIKTSDTPSSPVTATVTLTPTGSTAPVLTESVPADNAQHDLYVRTSGYIVSATAPGYGTDSTSITSGSTSPVNLSLPKTTTTATGSIRVTINGTGSNGASITVDGKVTSYGSSAVTISGLTVGDHTVFVTPSGSTTTLSKSATVTSGTPTDVIFDLPASPGSVAVTLSGTGNLGGATITVSGSAGSATGVTAANGTVTIGQLAAGTYTVGASTVDGGTGQASSVLVKAGLTTSVPVSVTYTGSLAVHVQKTDGTAVSGATVSLSGNSTTGVTDKSGNVTLPNLPSGTYTVTATATGPAATGSQSAGVAAGSTTAVTISVS